MINYLVKYIKFSKLAKSIELNCNILIKLSIDTKLEYQLEQKFKISKSKQIALYNKLQKDNYSIFDSLDIGETLITLDQLISVSEEFDDTDVENVIVNFNSDQSLLRFVSSLKDDSSEFFWEVNSKNINISWDTIEGIFYLNNGSYELDKWKPKKIAELALKKPSSLKIRSFFDKYL